MKKMETAKRKYQEIWEKIKLKEKATLKVSKGFVARVKKAVMKEKYNDLGFKVLNDHDHFYLKIVEEKIPGNQTEVIVKFFLKQSLGLEGVKR